MTVPLPLLLCVAIEIRVRSAVGLLLIVLVLVTSGSIGFDGGITGPEVDRMPYDAMVTLEDDTTIWPYTSRTTSFEQRTLSLNLIVYGSAEHTEQLLREETAADWSDLPEDRQDLAPFEDDDAAANQSVSTVEWGAADGASRWIWIETPDGQQQWLGESYQLEDGDYLGHRHHIRAYNDPRAGNWTAIQAHTEHWDWFHLRHTVHTIETTQGNLENEFMDQWYVNSLTREPFGNDGSADATGWVTVIDLNDQALPYVLGVLAIAMAIPFSTRGERFESIRTDPEIETALRAAMVIGAVVGLYLGVRFGAIGIERQFPAIPPKVIVAGFYPVIGIGLPVLVYLSARGLDERMAFAAAAMGFLIAILVDYTYLQVLRIPLETLVHRGTLAVAIGVIAAGASRTARARTAGRGYVRTGVLLWIAAMSVPLFQFI